jgi:hypothetical protein
MLNVTTLIITHCDMSMEEGDHFQKPPIYPFTVPEFYGELDESIRNTLFWEKMWQPNQPFEFAKQKMPHTMPICWTNLPRNLSRKLKLPVETIETTQKTLLYQSLLNSIPVEPGFLKEYEKELILTAQYKRNLEKTLIRIDEMKTGT